MVEKKTNLCQIILTHFHEIYPNTSSCLEKEKGKMHVSHSVAPPNPSPHLSSAGGVGMREMCVEVLVETKTNKEDDELSFMKMLKSADWERYCFQKDMIRFRPPFVDRNIIYGMFRTDYSSYDNQRLDSVCKSIKYFVYF